MFSKILRGFFSLVILLFAAFYAPAQTEGPKLQEYSFEGVLPLDFVFSSTQPPFPQGLLDAVRSGSLEIRVRERYMASTGMLTSHLFVVPTGAPLPLESPPPVVSPDTLRFTNAKVDQIALSDKPVPSVFLLGKVVYAAGQTAGPDLVGAANITTFGYEEGTPAKLMLWVSTVPGSLTTHIPLTVGNLNIVKPPPPPPPPTNQAPVAVITPENQTAILPFLTLDGTKSYDPDGDPITYSWRTIGQPVTILAPTSPTPQVQFPGRGYYTFELTVTDDKGLSGKATSIVLYLGQ